VDELEEGRLVVVEVKSLVGVDPETVVGRFGGESVRLLEPATSKCWRVT
jgi:hypothetical protein